MRRGARLDQFGRALAVEFHFVADRRHFERSPMSRFRNRMQACEALRPIKAPERYRRRASRIIELYDRSGIRCSSGSGRRVLRGVPDRQHFHPRRYLGGTPQKRRGSRQCILLRRSSPSTHPPPFGTRRGGSGRVKIPRDVSGARLAAVLCRQWGYAKVHQVGSHVILETSDPSHQRIAVPGHNPLRVGTLHSILRAVAEHKRTTRDSIIASL